MSLYTGTLSAQNTSVQLCTIEKPRAYEYWYANVSITGTFGTGTVTLYLSLDGGTTRVPLVYDGTATSAAVTAAGVVNVKCGWPAVNTTTATLWAGIGAATNPSISISVLDNR